MSGNDKPKTKLTFFDWIFVLFMILVLIATAMLGRMTFLEGLKTNVGKDNAEALGALIVRIGTERGKAGFLPVECSSSAYLPSVLAKSEALGPEWTPDSVEASESPDHEGASSGAESESQSQSPDSAKHSAKHHTEDSAKPHAEKSEHHEVDDKVAAKVSEPSAGAAPATVVPTWGECFKQLNKNPILKDMVNPFTDARPLIVDKCIPSNQALHGALVLDKLLPTPAGSAVPMVQSSLTATDPINLKFQIRIYVCDKGSYPIRITDADF